MHIRKMIPADRDTILRLMREFYDSPALLQQVPEKALLKNVEACLAGSPYVEGYTFLAEAANASDSPKDESKLDGTASPEEEAICGYGMVALSWSTEAGGPCVWVEDIYLTPDQRHRGNGGRFLQFVREQYPSAARLRLEVEPENEPAVKLYRRQGYRELPYTQMVIDENPLK